MVCTKCGNKGILNAANNKKFWFCQTCRDEIMPEVVKKPSKKEYILEDNDQPFHMCDGVFIYDCDCDYCKGKD